MTASVPLPIDSDASARLAADGLRLGLVSPEDRPGFAAWVQAVARGFHDVAMSEEKIEESRLDSGHKRISAVWDASLSDAATPVATIDSWVAELTVPGGEAVPSWAVSAVTVSPTHRRRGIARALLDAELSTAKSAGCAVAVLTVSESTIYGRFGFAPAVMTSDLQIDTRRASWAAGSVAGRVQFTTAEQLSAIGLDIVERIRRVTPGEIEYSGRLWERQLGRSVGDESAKSLRFVRYDDEDGVAQGFAVFTLDEDKADFTNYRLTVQTLVAATANVTAALWRFMIDHDLVATVTASLRPVDDPVRWMVNDFRAVKSSVVDHLWLRILDLRAALEARSYAGSGRVVIRVEDPMGLAEGTITLIADDGGRGVVEWTPDAAADVELTVNELAAIYLGGASARVLSGAGRIRGDVTELDRLFRSPVAPTTSIWF